MVAVATLLPTEWPSVRVLCITLCTWLWMMLSLSFAFACQMAVLPALYLCASASTRSYWLGWLLRLSALLFIDGHPLWTLRVVHGQRPMGWSEWWQRLLPAVSHSVSDSPPPLPSRVLVMVNHLSDLDPFVTARALLPVEHKYVAKASLFSIPVGGWAMTLAGDVAVHFTSAKGGWGLKQGSVGRMFEQCRRIVVDQRLPLLVFPEGTRDGRLQLKPFKKGMFDFAVLHGCSVLVMALDGSQRCWPFPGPFFERGECRVAFGRLLPPAQSAEQLMADTRQEMQRLIDLMTVSHTGGSHAPHPTTDTPQRTRATPHTTTTQPSMAGTTIPSTSASQ